MNKIAMPFSKARQLLKEGDIILFRNDGWVSWFIQRASEGKYSHVGIVSGHGANGDTIWECVEFLEGKGGRTVNLERYIDQYKGSLDVFRPSEIKRTIAYHETLGVIQTDIKLYPKKVTNIMRRMTGLPYGWKRIAWIAQHKLPFLRLFYSMDSVIDDSKSDLIYPVCSTAIAYAFSKTGFDLVHHRADNYTEPSDIARSPLLNYLFTLTS